MIENNFEMRSLGLFSHTDYMPFFKKKSPLAQMYNQQVLQKEPSAQRIEDFLTSLKPFADIIAQKREGEVDI